MNDIDMEHRAPAYTRRFEAHGDQVAFVTRPALFCAHCGSAVQQRLFGVIRREVWCVEKKCPQYQQRLNVFDPIVRGASHGSDDQGAAT